MKHDFDKIIDRKGTFCTQWDYIQDRFGVSDLLPFSISDTDFRAPKEIIDDLQKVLEHGIFGYTRWNHHEFKSKIKKHYEKSFSTGIDENRVLYSPSVMYSVSVLIRMLSKEDDLISVFDPMYDAFINVIKKNNRIINPIPLDFDNDYKIDFDYFEKSISKSKILLLCSPHNPTGKVFSKEELDKIVLLCKKYNVFIISDEIHSDIVLWENRHIPILKYYNIYKNIILVNSASKTFNIPALGGSYLLVPSSDIREDFLIQTRQKDFVNSAAIMGMIATMSAYEKCDYYIDELVSYTESNMILLKEFFETEFPSISFKMPQSTYLAWIDMRKTGLSSEEIQKLLVIDGKIGIMSGDVYGENGTGFLRMNLGCPRKKLLDGIEKIKYAFRNIEGDKDA
ncbi:putative C-S lyase [Peptacetobacter hominis]|uniref:cysteine-S-conjugate beta-lyase n=1 Tax=Peptacetobacter hominis TaxID=2743610 RepID=A0A544QUZ9_9FIRM|nr:PatB family C-S lyase [Peptacetobacter hominis]TQQ84515.1 putative C-S lyase [Peptacetobacter hominis]